MICGVCKRQVPLYIRKEHLIKYHKLGAQLVDWIIQTDNDLIALEPKIWTHQEKLEIPWPYWNAFSSRTCMFRYKYLRDSSLSIYWEDSEMWFFSISVPMFVSCTYRRRQKRGPLLMHLNVHTIAIFIRALIFYEPIIYQDLLW